MERKQRPRQNEKPETENKAVYYGNLGIRLADQGKIEEAVAAFRQAITLDSNYTNAHYCLGSLLSRQGLLDDAIDSFRNALELQPDHFDSLYNMANAFQMLNRLDEAVRTYRNAITLDPNHAATHANLGNTLKNQGKFTEAALSYKQGISVDPGFVNAYYNLGLLQMEQGQHKDAVETFKQGLALAPDYPAMNCNLGLALKELGFLDDAVASFRKALESDPNFSEAQNNLGNALQGMGQLEEAVNCFNMAIKNAPENVSIYVNLSNALRNLGRLEESEAVCRRSLQIDPELADSHFNLGIVLLRTGRLREGWREYEWRWQSTRFMEAPRVFPQPKWDGSSLKGKKILLWAEQGIGDEVRYASIIPDVLATGANVTIECNERLVDIFTRSFKGTDVRPAPFKEAEGGQEQFDYQCSLASLGHFFRNDFESFKVNSSAYLSASKPLVQLWKKRLKEINVRPKIGLSWSSTISGRGTFNASIKELAPVLSIPDVSFVNLQSHDSHKDIDEAQTLYGVDIFDWDDLDLRNDLENVAALTSCLDLVISFPTFAAELAGALGVSTLCFHSERTNLDFLGTGQSVWHPEMKYFTKNTPDEPWRRVFDEIAVTIQEMLKKSC